LADACRASSGRIAIDTEADSLHHYFEKVCLIQITLDGTDYVVDPLVPGVDLAPLLEALADRPLLLHGADYDLRMLRLSYGFNPRAEVYDTMLAAQIVGFAQLGLAALAGHFFSIGLEKKMQRADWSQRPLSRDLIVYAANDTHHLEALAGRLDTELERRGRVEWHREACARMVETSRVGGAGRDPEREWRVKGSGVLSRRALAVLREAWRWRDALAQRLDRPPFKVLPNQVLIELAIWGEAHPHEARAMALGDRAFAGNPAHAEGDAHAADDAHAEGDAHAAEAGPRLPRNCRGDRLAALRKAVAEGLAVSQSQLPPSRPPMERIGPYLERPNEALVQALQSTRDPIARRLALAPSVLAPRAALVAVAQNRPADREALLACTHLMRWQSDLLAEPLLQALANYSPPA
jgi:ribonuclease D